MIAENLFTGLIMFCILYVIYSVCYTFYKYILSKRIPVQSPIFSPSLTPQEDQSTQDTIKRVRASMKKQQQDMNTRALKSHDPSCSDVFNCRKDPCFVWAPDKIVSESIQVASRLSRKRIQEREELIETLKPKRVYRRNNKTEEQ